MFERKKFINDLFICHQSDTAIACEIAYNRAIKKRNIEKQQKIM
ncbi:hypothetical protein B4098_0646 [Heyndrickxia coagulans]|uniref:Uncharacterized protein n=1 Tax=Heyndrickxia coagulans TaxID=1398 RepID=A0A150K150_HEYCO|nr:hypothetical protein BCO26_0566 [Heyndrickxia coagulans 2-6]KYC63303.1 hypothetical protein B4098_0646 [Heyndrickxia coagulans]